VSRGALPIYPSPRLAHTHTHTPSLHWCLTIFFPSLSSHIFISYSIPFHFFFLFFFWCFWNAWRRFLRARKFDVPKAKAMLLSAEQWRKDENVDELVRCVCFVKSQILPVETPLSPPRTSYRTFEFKEKADVDKYYPQYYHKIDKVGR